ncbi:MAG TPA: hypothetical protein VFX45_00335 [Solirubrobacterales bacterium]|nr:hypothetical protein [Solirubrobacterales bacterium]
MSAEKKGPEQSLREIRKRLIEGTRIKVRYGRATLTVRRSVVILGAPLGEALKAHQRKAISAEEVAWRFLYEQTISHSPTFDWEVVKLNKLLPRVAAVVREPDLKARTPEELIAELERVHADELAAKKRLSEQIQKYAAPLSASYLKGFRAADLGLVTHQKQMKQIREMVEPLRQQQSLFKRQQQQIEQMQRFLRPAITLEAFGLTQSKVRQMLGLNLPGATTAAALARINNPFLEQDWRPAFERVAEIAREADAPEVAEAVEAVEITATKAEEEGPGVDLDAMREAIERLTQQLEESNQLAKETANREDSAETAGEEGKGNDSFSRQLILQVALMMIRWLIEAVFSAHLGIPFPPQVAVPPEASDQGPSEEPEPPDSLA